AGTHLRDARGRHRPGRHVRPHAHPGHPVGAMLVLAFVAGLATPPFEAARSAAIPDLVPEEDYGDALAFAGISVQAAVVVGSVMGGGMLVWLGANTALALNAASFLVSALIVLQLRGTPAAAPSAEGAGIGGARPGRYRNLAGAPPGRPRLGPTPAPPGPRDRA